MIKRHLNIKHNYTSTKNKLKTNPQNKTIEQSYQGLQTEGVRRWAQGQEEEEGKHKSEGRGEGSRDGCPGLPRLRRLASPRQAMGTPMAAGAHLCTGE